MMSRLDYFSYYFEKKHPDLYYCATELLCGIIFMFWSELEENEKRKAMVSLVNQMWAEDRGSARGLIVVALASLQNEDLDFLSLFSKNKILTEGLQHFDAAPEERMIEEKRVHVRTHKILKPVKVPGLAPVLEFYDEWRIPYDGMGNP